MAAARSVSHYSIVCSFEVHIQQKSYRARLSSAEFTQEVGGEEEEEEEEEEGYTFPLLYFNPSIHLTQSPSSHPATSILNE